MVDETLSPVLSVRGVHLRRGSRTLFADLHLEIAPGEVVVMEAEAGEGATSLLKVCGGLIPPDRGTVEVDGVDLHRSSYGRRRRAKKRMGFVFQEAALLQNLTLFDNVALPLRYHGSLPEKGIRNRVREILEAFDLEGLANDRPADLGLQEAHSASLARALGMGPEIVILDDFFSRLSRSRAKRLWDQIRSTAGDGLTALIGTTDRTRVPGEASRVLVLRGGRLQDVHGRKKGGAS